MKKLILISLLLIGIRGLSQVPFPGDNLIMKDKVPVRIDDTPVVIEAELEFEVIEVEQEEEETEKLRIVFWLHGLGGNGASWTSPAQASEDPTLNTQTFKARYIHSHVVDYNGFTDGNLYTAANNIRAVIRSVASGAGESYDSDRTRNFIIAHSQGGMVSRELLHNDVMNQYYGVLTAQERGYGGLVTVSSPLQGAQILNNQEMIIDMAGDACEKLTEGPLLTNYTNILSSPFIETVVKYIGRELVDQNVCSIASETALPLLFSDRLSSITNDYYVGSSRITTFNNDVNNPYYNSIPKVAFYGVEPYQNIFWRTARWIDDAPHQVEVWQANDDYKFYDEQMHPKYLNYLSNYTYYEEMWDTYYWVPALRSYYLKRMQAWRNGYDWLNNANRSWESVIGAGEYQIVGWSGMSPQFDFVRYESDGVVVAGSSMNLPGATHPPVKLNGILENGEWTGSSHMQIRNDGALEDRLTKLYNGQYGDYFKTNIKY